MGCRAGIARGRGYLLPSGRPVIPDLRAVNRHPGLDPGSTFSVEEAGTRSVVAVPARLDPREEPPHLGADGLGPPEVVAIPLPDRPRPATA